MTRQRIVVAVCRNEKFYDENFYLSLIGLFRVNHSASISVLPLKFQHQVLCFAVVRQEGRDTNTKI